MTQLLISWLMMGFGVIGFVITFPLWLKGKISQKTMVGVTLALSWAALWYTAYISIVMAQK